MEQVSRQAGVSIRYVLLVHDLIELPAKLAPHVCINADGRDEVGVSSDSSTNFDRMADDVVGPYHGSSAVIEVCSDTEDEGHDELRYEHPADGRLRCQRVLINTHAASSLLSL